MLVQWRFKQPSHTGLVEVVTRTSPLSETSWGAMHMLQERKCLDHLMHWLTKVIFRNLVKLTVQWLLLDRAEEIQEHSSTTYLTITGSLLPICHGIMQGCHERPDLKKKKHNLNQILVSLYSVEGTLPPCDYR